MSPIHPSLAKLAAAAARTDFAALQDALAVAVRSPGWLRPEHRVGDPAGYMRHVLYVDPADAFVITAITWLPGQKSAKHGHQVWCAFGVAEGVLTEARFESGQAQTALLAAGQVADADLHGAAVHRVSNRGTQTVVSLHLYGVAAARLTTGINRLVDG